MFEGITREHIIEALKRIDNQGVPESRKSRKYNLVHNGKKYPPKYVISVAHEIAKVNIPEKFYPKEAIDFLRKLEFTVEEFNTGAGKTASVSGYKVKNKRTKKEDATVQKLMSELEKRLMNWDTVRCYGRKLDIEISSHDSLIYKVTVMNRDGRVVFEPPDPQNVRRGQNAFEVDILIKDKKLGLPLVVIEVKLEKFSTHDVITYSQKALKHKDIYPYLRYGFVVMCGKNDYIERRFFVHNQGLDFAFILRCNGDSFNTADLDTLAEIIKEQIRSACFLVDVLVMNKKVRGFSERLEERP